MPDARREGMTETMTADDAKICRIRASDKTRHDADIFERAEATFHALAKQWAESERLRNALAASQREVERLRAEQITRAVDALPDGTTLIKTDKLDALRAQLAAAREDTRRAVMVAIEQTVQSCAAQSKYPSETWMVDYAKILGHLP